MTETQFISQNEPKWKELEAFNLTLQKKGIKALSRLEIRAFAETFRSVGYHLAYAKTHYPRGSCLPYLTHIVGVAHNHYYIREKGNIGKMRHYLIHGFPAATRKAWLYVLISAILFMAGMVFASTYVSSDISRFGQIFPFEIAGDDFELDLGDGQVVWDHTVMSAAIMTNNIRVAIMAFVFGITAGIGTIWILFYNGMIVGALASFVSQTGGQGDMVIFWSLILPHGVPELVAIFISGACGLMIGHSLLVPGNYSRTDAVKISAKSAAELIPGIVVILIIAGLIEGFLTPLGISPFFKLAFSLIVLVGMSLYFAKC